MNTTESFTEASDWLLRLKNENVSQADLSAWLDWCSAKPENLEAFERAQSLYHRLRNVEDGTRASFLSMGDVRRERFAWPIAVAASVIAALGLIVWKPWSSLDPASERGEYRAEHGAQRELVLADRTKVTLGSASTVTSAFTASARYIDLRDGEAYFEVEPDRNRPFVVRAGLVSVTAIGTAFNVRRTGERAIVSVTEGSVDVLPLGERSVQSNRNAPVRVQAGQQAVYALTMRGVMVASIEPSAATAWLSGRREYMIEPLGSVIDDVNRYSPRRIELSDARLRDLVFTGTVMQHRIDEWVMALDGVFPVRVVAQRDGHIEIEPREENFR
jgi:transmembrane sensor